MADEQDDKAAETEKPPKAQKAPARWTDMPDRRGFVRMGLYGALGLGVGHVAGQYLDSQASGDEKRTESNALPVRSFTGIRQGLTELIMDLKAKGYDGIFIGDNHHHSSPARVPIKALLSSDEINVTDCCVEIPSAENADPEVGRNLNGASDRHSAYASDEIYQHIQSLNERGRKIDIHYVDTDKTPTAKRGSQYVKNLRGAANVLDDVDYMLYRRSMADAFVQWFHARNVHMADDVAEKAIDPAGNAAKKRFFVFPVGSRHLRVQDNPVSLIQAKLGNKVKLAVLDIIPVQHEQMDGKLFRENGRPDRFALTVDDAEKGYDVSPDGVVRIAGGEGGYVILKQLARQQRGFEK